jgi:hypothetical protein
MLVKEQVFGALQLVASGIRFIHRFDDNRADAGFQRAPNSINLDQMFR